jgi:hypothetical protein
MARTLTAAALRIALLAAFLAALQLAGASSHAASPQAPQYEERQGHMLLLNGASASVSACWPPRVWR